MTEHDEDFLAAVELVSDDRELPTYLISSDLDLIDVLRLLGIGECQIQDVSLGHKPYFYKVKVFR